MTDLMGQMSRLFDNVLGCSLEFQSTDKIGNQMWSDEDLLSLNVPVTALPPYIESDTEDAFGFPVNLQGKFLGLMVVRGFKNANPKRLMILAELMSMTLASSHLQLEDHSDHTALMEKRIA